MTRPETLSTNAGLVPPRPETSSSDAETLPRRDRKGADDAPLSAPPSLQSVLDDTLDALTFVRGEITPGPWFEEYGVVTYIGQGIARVHGLPNVKSEELVRF